MIYTNGEILAEVTRSEIVESSHAGHMVLLNSDGSILLSKGDPSQLTFPRSTIKSIQASAMVRHGLDLEPRLLALACSSHSGAAMHQDGAVEILKIAGLTIDALQNAKDKPLGDSERRAWGAQEPTRLAMNCSGKHSAMLLTCVKNNWPIENYLEPEHPLQVACREELELLAGEKVSLVSTDGCGAPLFVISLLGLARAIRAITISADPIHQRVISACIANPDMVTGVGRDTSVLMKSVPGLFAKDGAEAVEIGSLPDGRTYAIKFSDGSARASGVVIPAALKKFGVDAPSHSVPIYGGPHVIGSIRAAF
jgi:L-asparaginase II